MKPRLIAYSHDTEFDIIYTSHGFLHGGSLARHNVKLEFMATPEEAQAVIDFIREKFSQ